METGGSSVKSEKTFGSIYKILRYFAKISAAGQAGLRIESAADQQKG